jgi:TolA-binding protein
MWVALAALLGALGSAAFSARSNSRAVAVEASKVDAAAYDRAKTIYESALETLEEQLERMRTRLEIVTQHLAQEQDASIAMRAQIHQFRIQVVTLERTVADLRVQLAKAGIPAAESEGPP